MLRRRNAPKPNSKSEGSGNPELDDDIVPTTPFCLGGGRQKKSESDYVPLSPDTRQNTGKTQHLVLEGHEHLRDASNILYQHRDSLASQVVPFDTRWAHLFTVAPKLNKLTKGRLRPKEFYHNAETLHTEVEKALHAAHERKRTNPKRQPSGFYIAPYPGSVSSLAETLTKRVSQFGDYVSYHFGLGSPRSSPRVELKKDVGRPHAKRKDAGQSHHRSRERDDDRYYSDRRDHTRRHRGHTESREDYDRRRERERERARDRDYRDRDYRDREHRDRDKDYRDRARDRDRDRNRDRSRSDKYTDSTGRGYDNGHERQRDTYGRQSSSKRSREKRRPKYEAAPQAPLMTIPEGNIDQGPILPAPDFSDFASLTHSPALQFGQYVDKRFGIPPPQPFAPVPPPISYSKQSNHSPRRHNHTYGSTQASYSQSGGMYGGPEPMMPHTGPKIFSSAVSSPLKPPSHQSSYKSRGSKRPANPRARPSRFHEMFSFTTNR